MPKYLCHITLSFLVLAGYLSIVAADSIPVPKPPSQKASATAIADAVRPLPFKSGDALMVVTYPDSTNFFSGLYTIDGEGYVDFPIIGYIKVVDLSSTALEKLLSEKYVDFMRYPYIKVRPLIRVTLNGGFYQPGLYWVDPHATLWDAVKLAGGTQRTDGFKKMKWRRNNTVLQKNLTAQLEQGKSLYQIGFKTGDQITILHRPEQSGWEVFQRNVLPIFSIAISATTSIVSLYSVMVLRNRY